MTDGEKGAVLNKTNKSEIRKRVGFATEVFQRYGDDIRAIIHFNVKDKSKADDIFQEFFVSIIHKPIPSGIEDVKAYVYRAVTNDVIDLFRQTKNHRDHLHKYAECRKKSVIPEDPQKIAIQVESTKKMFQRFGHGFSIKDTAKRMHVNKRFVSRYLSIALKKMRQIVLENEEEIT
jgi:DNA-directed RNA polymerase specialized sigma24 family protein